MGRRDSLSVPRTFAKELDGLCRRRRTPRAARGLALTQVFGAPYTSTVDRGFVCAPGGRLEVSTGDCLPMSRGQSTFPGGTDQR